MLLKLKQSRKVSLLVAVFLVAFCFVAYVAFVRILIAIGDTADISTLKFAFSFIGLASLFVLGQSFFLDNSQTVVIDNSGMQIMFNKTNYNIPWSNIKKITFLPVPIPFFPFIKLRVDGILVTFSKPDNYIFDLKHTADMNMVRVVIDKTLDNDPHLLIRMDKINVPKFKEELKKVVDIQ